MPNAKVLSEKHAIVAALTEQLKNASSGVLVDYKGITVAEDTALRTELRQNEVQYGVVKNTLVRFALNNVGLEGLDDVLNGTTSLATSAGDPIAPMRVVNKYVKQLYGRQGYLPGGDPGSGRAALQGGPAGSGSGHDAGSHYQPGYRPEGHRREERRARRGRGPRCRVIYPGTRRFIKAHIKF